MSRVLIAGCGYVGVALAGVLAARGDTVFGLRRDPSKLPPGVRPVGADLRDPSTLTDLPRDIDAAVFCAAADAGNDSAYRAIYVDGLRNLLDALQPADLRRFVLVSSTAVYGQDGGEIVDEHSATRPTRYAGRRMLESEAVAAAAGIPLTIVRAAGIYGPGRTRLLDRVRRGDIELGERESYTNRIHRDDLAGFIAHLLKLAQPEPIYIAADDDPADRGEVVNWLAARLGVTPPPRGGSAVAGANKRCSNAGLHRSGFELRHPSYRDGYVAVIGRYLSGE